MKVTYRTFGCKVNQYDTNALRERAEALGFETGEGSAGDIMVINTCAVTARAERKVRKAANAALRSGTPVLLFGCAVRLRGGSLLPEASRLHQALDLQEALELLIRMSGGTPPALPAWEGHGIRRFHGHARAFLKVGDGCPGGCTYCVVPGLRGPSRSRPRDEIKAEAALLAEAGYREIVLTAIHLGLWGADLDPPERLEDLLDALLRVPVAERIRLSSLEPGELTDAVLERMAASEVMAPHLHVPLQSADPDVLQAMGRQYSPEDYLDGLERARRAVPGLAVSTDLIAGFPGETDTAHRRTLAFIRTAGFSRLHVFPFSPRPGTPAADLPGRPHDRVTAERAAELGEAGREEEGKFRRNLLGLELRVLTETAAAQEEESVLSGTSGEYVTVRFHGPKSLVGSLVRVRATHEEEGGLRGER
jgi:threonylcarbamoyladenosine tRNA methylthiotransferase MtaB